MGTNDACFALLCYIHGAFDDYLDVGMDGI